MDRTKSLDELEDHTWGEPPHTSYLVKTCHELRRKPIGEFSIEDLRIMIGQKIGLRYLVPLAVEILVRDPLAEGDFYPGDLLKNVLEVPADSWRERTDLAEALREVLRVHEPLPEQVAGLVAAFIGKQS